MARPTFTKAQSGQAFLKIGMYGKAGTGKTLTSLLFAEGLAAKEGKRIACVDTELGTEFYAMDIPERRIHPVAFDFDRLVTRSLLDTIGVVEGVDPKEYGVVMVDSITHLWEAATNSYTGKRMSTGGIPVQAWGAIKKPYKKLMSLLLDGNFHSIICGREGVVIEEDEDGDPKVTGSKMKAEGETPHEPHILARMRPELVKDGAPTIKIFFEKDRSGILSGRSFEWPTYATIEPVVRYLSGGQQGKLGSPEEIAEHDAAVQERQAAQAAEERKALFTNIRDSLTRAGNADELKAAWSLTQGKKGRLGDDFFEQLTTIKDAKKAEIIQGVA